MPETPAHQPAVLERSPYRRHWSRLCAGPMADGGVLNHGSFGACPDEVLDAQARIRDAFEAEPTGFINERWQGMTDDARDAVAEFVGAAPAGLVFVRNATEGVNAVVRSLDLSPGDELLTSTHEYNACNNVLRYAAERAGARVVVADIPFPLPSDAADANRAIVDAYLAHVTERTRLAMVSHVTSPTALVMPVKQLQDELGSRGVDLLIDGAHAPGMLDVDVDDVGAPWYTANCHKWMCGPKGAAFLWTRADKRATTRPALISHGHNTARTDRSRYQVEFDWTGTHDPSAYLALPAAIDCIARMQERGWDGVRAHNRALALRGRDVLMDALGVAAPPAPDALVGSIASLPIPDRPDTERSASGSGMAIGYADPLQRTLVHAHNIQAPIVPWPKPPARLVRISAQLYNHESEYHALARALTIELEQERHA